LKVFSTFILLFVILTIWLITAQSYKKHIEKHIFSAV